MILSAIGRRWVADNCAAIIVKSGVKSTTFANIIAATARAALVASRTRAM